MSWRDQFQKEAATPAPTGWRAQFKAEKTAEPTPTPEVKQRPKGPQVGAWEALAAGAGQGAMGVGDELGAAMQATDPSLVTPGTMSTGQELAERLKTYRQARFENRQTADAAREQHPLPYYGGMLGSALLTAPALPARGLAAGATLGPKLATGALNAFGQGAAFGAGASEADLTRGQGMEFLGDVLKSGVIAGGLGAGLAGGGHLLGKAREAFGRTAAGAESRAAQASAEDAAAAEASKLGELRQALQEGNRQIENLQRLKETGNATPGHLATLESLRPKVAELEQRLMGSTLQAVPEQVGKISGLEAELAALKEGRAAAVASGTESRLSPSANFREHVLPRAKRYALNVVGTMLGGPQAGLAAQNFRPMLQSVGRMLGVDGLVYNAARAGGAAAGAGERLLGAAASTPLTTAAPAAALVARSRPLPRSIPSYALDDAEDEDSRMLAEALRRSRP